MAVALVASLLALTTPVAAKQSVSTVRVSGTDRFATSVAVSTAASVAGANNTHFVLVNGSSFADALSAAALAGAKNGTIILLPADGTISASATARMAAASNITIVGGFSALPATVETTMRTLRATATITRVSGGDRYATAANVASNIVNTAGGSLAAVNGKKSVFLASGGSFADAVIAAPGAYAGPNNSATTAVVPIMLTNTDTLSEATKAQLVVLGVKQVFVLGGTAAVSAATAAEVEALGMTVVRLAGATRYATAVAIADKLTAKTTAGGWGFDDDDIALVNIEQSGGGADALAAASYLGQSKAVALGAGPGALATETSTWLTAHNGATGVAKIHAIGGTVAVSAAQLTSADAAGTIAGPVATITALPGQSSVTVAFSQTVTAT
jgi:putative cell wall-binding protein